MKNIIFLFIVVFSITAYSQTGTALSFESKVGNYGEIKQGTPAELKFVFKNTSQQVIEIKDVKSNTRAISFKIEDRQIEPGQTSFISVIHNSKEVGTIRNTITVLTSEESAIYTLAVRGSVVKP